MNAFLRRLALAVSLSFACVGAMSVDATAQQDKDLKTRAREYVTKGLAAQAAGLFDEAIIFYNDAYTLLPHPELLFNLGQAYRLKGDRVIALDYYRKYVAIQPNGRAAKEALEWTVQIEHSMQEEAAAAARKFEQERMAEEARKAEDTRKAEEARKAEEPRKEEAAKRGEDVRKVEEATQGEEESKKGQPEGTTNTAAQSAGNKSGAVDPNGEKSTTNDGRSSSFPWRKTAAGAALAASLVSLGVTYVYQTKANDLYNDYLKTQPPDESIRDEAKSKGHYVAVSLVVGTACLGTAAYLWFTAPPSRKEPVSQRIRTAPLLTNELAGISILGGF
jgi:tetratricopeptide (TPR) repeat protein